ncbi:MAG: hypothetical protein Q7S40_17590 [Opitutaceae bacterium]|nr:hypothetical protein [Opitutaceae bacterium]
MNEPVFLSREQVLELHRAFGLAEKRLDKPGLAAVFRQQLSL